MSLIENSVRYYVPHLQPEEVGKIEVDWGNIKGIYDPVVSEGDLETVSNIHVLPTIGSLGVLVRSSTGWELPGGTVEAGEGLDETLRRELTEEVGTRPESFSPCGVIRCFSTAAKPFRPHIPHPVFNILVGLVHVESIGAPTGWDTVEGHCEVSLTPVPTALARLKGNSQSSVYCEILGSVLRESAREEDGFL